MLTPNQPQQPGQPQDNTEQNSQNRKQQGTGFVGIGKMLNANQGAGQKEGAAIGSGLQNKAGDIAKGIQQGQAGFQAGMNQSVQTANNTINQGKQVQKQENESDADYQARIAGAAPNASPTNYAELGKNVQNASYTGPSGLANANQIQAQAASAGALRNLAGNTAGQAQLLRNMVAQRGNYSTGQNALDSLLLGQGGQQAVQQGKTSLNGVENQATNATQNASNQANANSTAIATNKLNLLQNIQNQLNGTGDAATGGITGINTQATNQSKDYNAQGARLSALLRGEDPDHPGMKLTPDQMKNLNPKDLDLINNMDQYGLNSNENIYGGSASTDYNNVLGQLTQNANLNQTNGRYTGNQGAAANNLATFLGDQSAGKINANPFEDKLFSSVTNQNVMANNANAATEDQAKTAKANSLAQMKAQYDQLYNMSGGGTKPNGDPVSRQWRDKANQILAQMQAMGADPNRSAASFQQEAASNTGKQKSLKQLALERLGQTYTPPTQEPDPKKLTQV